MKIKTGSKYEKINKDLPFEEQAMEAFLSGLEEEAESKIFTLRPMNDIPETIELLVVFENKEIALVTITDHPEKIENTMAFQIVVNYL